MQLITNEQITVFACTKDHGYKKGIGYAYPSSPLAVKLGRGKLGCFYVYARRHVWLNELATRVPFATVEDARKHISDSGWLHLLPWCKLSK